MGFWSQTKEGENVEKLIKNVRKDLKAPEVKGKKVQVLESSEKCTIFIGNLPLDLDTAKMRALCEPHGKDDLFGKNFLEEFLVGLGRTSLVWGGDPLALQTGLGPRIGPGPGAGRG